MTNSARGRKRSAVRCSVADILHAGLCGSVDTLAAYTGWPPEHVRNAIKEMRRSGEVARLGVDQVRTGRRGAPRSVYGAQAAGVHLADVLRGWACS